jgi:hypothetical protein
MAMKLRFSTWAADFWQWKIDARIVVDRSRTVSFQVRKLSVRSMRKRFVSKQAT